jgi:hypothetical protein
MILPAVYHVIIAPSLALFYHFEAKLLHVFLACVIPHEKIEEGTIERSDIVRARTEPVLVRLWWQCWCSPFYVRLCTAFGWARSFA